MNGERAFSFRLRILWDRARSFLVDWVAIAYLLLLVHFLGAYYFRFHLRYDWLAWLVGAALIAQAVRALGASPGLRLFDLQVVGPNGAPAAVGPRLMRLALWPLSVLSVGAGVWLSLARDDGATWHDRFSRTRLAARSRDEAGPAWWKTAWGILTLAIVALTYWAGSLITEVDLVKLFGRASAAQPIFQGLLTPDWSLLSVAVKNIIITIFLALVATTLAIPVAFAMSFLGARNLMTGSAWGRVVYYAVRTVMNITRSIEPLVWAIIFSVWVGIGPFAGTLALAIHSVAGLGKLYSEQLESISSGPMEAISSTGAGRIHMLRWAVVPQIVPPFLSFTIYRWDINVRMATIIGLVGGGGIGQMLMQYQQLVKWQAVGLCVWLIALVVWIMDILSAKIREKLI